jgi:hypothetical protein
MPRRQSFVLGGVAFPTKEGVVLHCRRILTDAGLGDPLTEHHAFLSDLIARHPAFTEKVGAGILGFEVREHLWRGKIRQRGFYVVRQDGSSADFSFYECLKDERQRSRGSIREACREAVAADCASFKGRSFNGSRFADCALSGQRIHWDQAHVDHAPPWPFSKIVDAWLERIGREPEVVNTDDMTTRFADPADSAGFLSFHDERAALRIVEKRLNMSRGARDA